MRREFNVADLYSALRAHRDTVGQDLTPVKGQVIFDSHYPATNKVAVIDTHPETGQPHIRHAESSIPYENKHTIDLTNTDWRLIGLGHKTLEVSHQMPHLTVNAYTKDVKNYGKIDYGSWEPEHVVAPDKSLFHRVRLGFSPWYSRAEFDYPDLSNQPLHKDTEDIYGIYAPYSSRHHGGIHDIIKEMTSKPTIGGVSEFRYKGSDPSYKPMSKDQMKHYFESDNAIQRTTPSHLINVYGLTGEVSRHVLNLDTEQIQEGHVDPKKGWLL